MRHPKIFVISLLVAMLVMGMPADAGSDLGRDLSRAYLGTARFHSLSAAQAAGYGGPLEDLAGISCITSPGVGVMGVHYVNGALVGDAVLDAARPEVLVYQPTRSGRLKLVAAEYVVFQGAWLEAGNTAPPRLFGRALTLVPAGNRYGLPPFYEIHAWIWQYNPSGTFQDWNPRGSCD